MMIPDPEQPTLQAIDTDTGELLPGLWMAKIGTPTPSLADLGQAEGWTHVGYGKMSYEEEADQEDLAAARSWNTATIPHVSFKIDHFSIMLLDPKDIARVCDADLARTSNTVADYRAMITAPTYGERS